MNFKEFFPVFRDSILGLTYLHSKNIVHRNIKPSAIAKIEDWLYKITDYGEGISLNYDIE